MNNNQSIECAKKLFNNLEKEGINIKFRRQLKLESMGTIIKNMIKQ